MSHNTTHRRNLASSLDHPKQPSMDPTIKKHHPTTTTTKPHHHHHHHHQHPDPTSPPSTIQNISNHFSKLYTNHKILKASSTHHHHHPSVDNTHLNNSSCTTLTKSKSHHGRRYLAADVEKETTKTMVKDKLVKVKPPFEEVHDIDKAFVKQKTIEKNPSSNKECKKIEPFHEDEQDLKKKDVIKRSSFSLAGNGGRRRSFCSSQTELADFLSCNGVKVVSVDMPPFMQIHAVDCARKAYDSLEKFTARTLAFTLKKEFDGVYGPAWHCIVGTSFGSFVTHSVGGFMYFSMDHKLYVLLFKTTVQKTD